METILGAAAAIAGVAMGLAPILQIRKMLEARSSRDVSIGFLVILLINFIAWFMYGLTSKNLVVMIPNVVSITTSIAAVLVAVRLRRTKAMESGAQ